MNRSENHPHSQRRVWVFIYYFLFSHLIFRHTTPTFQGYSFFESLTMSLSKEDLHTLPTDEIMKHALDMWSDLTGVSTDQTSFRMGDMDVRYMNQVMDEMLKMEPEGTTAYLLLECFLREYLEGKTFTAAEIMKDYEANSKYLKKAEALFSVVQSERALEMASAFRERVIQGVKHYDADRSDVLDMIGSADILPFLRRDALSSFERLQPFQFLQGKFDTAPAQIIDHVYIAWDVNDLLLSLRDMPVSGVAVVLIRNPSSPDRSYFSFAMRNGENVTLFTDKTRPAYPGQEDVLAGRGGRGASRSYASRASENHFPYQIIKTSYDEDGELVFNPETAPVASGKSVVPVMAMKELPPHQVIWLTMMLSLISEKFWKKSWQAKQLSYTGAMVQRKAMLVEEKDGTQLPAAKGYIPISLEDVTIDQMVVKNLSEQFEMPSSGVNAWLEERYRHTISEQLLNQWFTDGSTRMLPSLQEASGSKLNNGDQYCVEISDGIVEVCDLAGIPSWERPSGYKLQTFSPTDFGSEEELKKDRLYIARSNMARGIQREANREYHERRKEVSAWYGAAVNNNLDDLLPYIGRRSLDLKSDPAFRGDQRIMFGEVKGKIWDYTYSANNPIGEYSSYNRKWLCPLTDAVASWRCLFDPETSADLAWLAGCEISDLPDVLQNWKKRKPMMGNHLLNRMDPMDHYVDDPWMKLGLDVNVYLSRRALTRIEKEITTQDQKNYDSR